MRHHTRHRRVPRAGVDRIDDEATAWALVATAVHRPLRAETILVLLDRDRFGRTIVVVTDTHDPDSVVGAVECITRTFPADDLGGIVVASIRPLPIDTERDIDRWLEMSDIADQVGVELLEWFVIDDVVRCPRDDLGEAPRW